MIHCPSCHGSCTEVIESRLCSNGTRRRRHACLTCTHRWTTWDGERPDPSEVSKRKPRRPPRRPANGLTEDQVREILLGHGVSHLEMARRVGRSPEAIRQLRYGITHAKLLPEIARWGQDATTVQVSGPSCYCCQHWRSGCTFGFPDPTVEGPGFARDCHLYEPLTQSTRRACPTSVQ